MERLDAKAIRERLNRISLAITSLEHDSGNPQYASIATAARSALSEIAILVTDDEMEEHGTVPPNAILRRRRAIRAQAAARQHGGLSPGG